MVNPLPLDNGLWGGYLQISIHKIMHVKKTNINNFLYCPESIRSL